MHRTTVVTAAASTGLALVGALAIAAPAIADVVRASGEVTTLPAGLNNPLVPAGASARAQYVPTADGGTRVTLHLTGFAAGHTYGAHAHVADCDQGEGGPHFMKVPLSEGGTVDASNEIWLDVTTNESGNGHSSSEHVWQIAPAAPPRSVIIHALHTSTGSDGSGRPAGTAGPKLACLQVER